MFHKGGLLCLIVGFITLVAVRIRPGLAQQSTALPLAGLGPYKVGVLTLTFTDTKRGDMKLPITVWYPAKGDQPAYTTQAGPAVIKEPGVLKMEPKLRSPNASDLDSGQPVTVLTIQGDWAQVESTSLKGWVRSENLFSVPVEPDKSKAPYPLILYSHPRGSTRWDDRELFQHLASHGFIVAAIGHLNDGKPTNLIDRPLDVIFTLNTLAEITQGNLVGLIDTTNAGVLGHSYGGYTALATNGARVDPDGFLDWATHRETSPPTSLTVVYGPNFVKNGWPGVAAYSAQVTGAKVGELWPPVTDRRIHAVMPVAPVLGMLFGERGLSAATVPTLILVGSQDEVGSRDYETVPMFAQLGSKERYLITFVGAGHRIEDIQNGSAYYKQFATAFFGLYLQGNKADAEYLTPEFIHKFKDLAWGTEPVK